MIRFLLFFFAIMTSLIELSYSQTTVNGHVYGDTISFKGVKNCRVLLFKNGKKVAKAKTAKTGFYQFRKPIVLDGVTMKFKKKDYSGITVTEIHSKQKEFSVEILLGKFSRISHDVFQGTTKVYRMSPSGG